MDQESKINKLKITMAFLIVIILLVGIGITKSKPTNINAQENEEKLTRSDFQKYFQAESELTKQQFVAEYEKAKQNRLKYERLEQYLISGDYKKSFVVGSRYQVRQSFNEGEDEKNIQCLKDNINPNDESSGRILVCGFEAEAYDNAKIQPRAFVSEKDNILYDYDSYLSETKDRYYIKGVFYTFEYCEAVKASLTNN